MHHLRVFLVVLFLSSVSGFTQVSHSSGASPKLGLALEGGGALGLAHIGVIQYLEQHRIPVSYIAGTSMGGLVGGVYATGRNAEEVRARGKEHRLGRGDWRAGSFRVLVVSPQT